MLIEQLKHFAKGGSGPINDACAQAIDEIERLQEAKRQALHVADERSKENVSLRRTLEQHAVKNRGGPFWRCEYCEAMSQTPIAFKHKPDCVMAGSIAPLQAERPYGEVLDEMDHEAKYQPATNYVGANPITVVTLAQFLHDGQPIMIGGRSQPLSVYKEFARLILSEFILRRKPFLSSALPSIPSREGVEGDDSWVLDTARELSRVLIAKYRNGVRWRNWHANEIVNAIDGFLFIRPIPSDPSPTSVMPDEGKQK